MFEMTVPFWEIVLRTVIVYIVVFALLRVLGKRELGQMNATDLVVILVIANAVQNAMNGGDNSLTAGVVAACTLVGMNLLADRLLRRVPFLTRYFVEEPTLLLEDGKPIKAHMDREDVTMEELEMAARERGIPDLKDVRTAILEPDGSISIITKDQAGRRGHRHVRQFRQRP